MNFAIIPNLTRANAAGVTKDICAKLSQLKISYSMSSDMKQYFGDTSADFLPEQDMLKNCTLLITVGGDGTIIHSAKKAAEYSKPVLGVNAGRLAFMAGLESHELDLLEKLITGDYCVDERMMLKTYVEDGGKVTDCGYSINDTVFMRSENLSVSELNVSLNGRHFNRYLGDGVIIATPTGSTAYSLSAGGPVVDPMLEGIILTPLCAHSVFSRSFVFEANSKLTVSPASEKGFNVCCDGNQLIPVSENGRAVVERADATASFIRLKPDNFMDVLNCKMMQWNKDSVY